MRKFARFAQDDTQQMVNYNNLLANPLIRIVDRQLEHEETEEREGNSVIKIKRLFWLIHYDEETL